MHLSILQSLAEVSAEQWNRVAGENPFVRHEFLHALERTGCVGGDSGWETCHLALYDEAGARARLFGAVPLYRKHHSYGEYVFDWAWADAYARHGREYYPKLVAAVPFTPATGPRLLVAPEADRADVARRLIEGALALTRRTRASSLHWLFPTSADAELLGGRGLLRRTGCQFHWSNAGYRDFQDFLATFASQKRYNLKRERRQVREAGVAVEAVAGSAVGAPLWDTFYRYYRATVRAHGGIAYLKREFFHALGAAMGSRVVLFVARRARDVVGTALALRGGDTLYGRYWGGRADIPGLHFESCYYAPIEYCIAAGLARCEAGAQGSHKIARGFVPTTTYSAHWLRHPEFREAVAAYLERERDHVGATIDELNEHLPFRRGEAPPGARRE